MFLPHIRFAVRAAAHVVPAVLGIVLVACGGGGNSAHTSANIAIPAVAPSPSGDASASSANAVGDSGSSPAGDPQLTPLSKDDIEFYLDVMRAAAERVQHPTAHDLDALRRQQAFASNAEAAAQSNAAQEASVEAALAKAQAAMTAAMQSGDEAKIQAAAAQQQQALQTATGAIQAVAMPDSTTMNLALNLSNGQADRQIVEERHLDSKRYERVASVIDEILVPPGTPMADCGGSGCGDAPDAAELQREQAHAAGVARNRKLLLPYVNEIRPLQAVVRKRKT